MDEKKITKFAFGCALMFLFFRFFYQFPDENARPAVEAVFAALTAVSDGAPALIFLAKKKQFGTKEAVFAAIYAGQLAALGFGIAGGFQLLPAAVLSVLAAVLIVWQSLILNPPKKGGSQR